MHEIDFESHEVGLLESAFQIFTVYTMKILKYILKSVTIFLKFYLFHLLNKFLSQVVLGIKNLWPAARLIHWRPYHFESQGDAERLNRVVRERVTKWMKANGGVRVDPKS